MDLRFKPDFEGQPKRLQDINKNKKKKQLLKDPFWRFDCFFFCCIMFACLILIEEENQSYKSWDFISLKRLKIFVRRTKNTIRFFNYYSRDHGQWNCKIVLFFGLCSSHRLLLDFLMRCLGVLVSWCRVANILTIQIYSINLQDLTWSNMNKQQQQPKPVFGI